MDQWVPITKSLHQKYSKDPLGTSNQWFSPLVGQSLVWRWSCCHSCHPLMDRWLGVWPPSFTILGTGLFLWRCKRVWRGQSFPRKEDCSSTKSIGKLTDSLVKWTHPARGEKNGSYHLFQQKMCVNNIEPKDKNSLYSSFSHSVNIKHLLCAKHYSRWE